ncbi:MAG TPA: M48 family metalloprotease [Pyrinomonadaceae bacterium]
MTGEVVTLKLAVITSLSVTGLVLAIWRGFVTWRATRQLITNWLNRAEPVSLENISIPAYRIDHQFPVIAVVGAIRPRLFIANQVFDVLSREEIRAVVAHESGHIAAHDNLKRALMRACRDLLMIVPCGRSLDLAWAASAEEAADEYAACACGSFGALNLADAMIKISRAVQIGARPTMHAGAFLIDETGGDVARRVRRLTEAAAATDNPYRQGDAIVSGLIKWAFPASILLLIAFIATDSDILKWTHIAIEQVMRLLQ